MRLLPLALLIGCPFPDDDDKDDDTGAGGPVEADLVLLVDNSSSMEDESEAVALAADELVAAFLADGDREWQVGVTTVTTDPSAGSAGVAGALVGEPIALGDADAAERLREQVLCEATCWNELELPSDPSYSCGEAATEVSVEYLDCACGVDAWKDQCGGGDEEGLEAALLAGCRAVEAPPEICYQYASEGGGSVSTVIAGAEGTNAGLLRGGVAHFLVISDEGDASPRAATGDADVAAYVEAFDALGLSWRFHAFGPAWDGTNGDCLSGAQPWSVERYQNAAVASGGVYVEMTDLAADCAAADPMDVVAAVLASI
ncbi:MAG: hypothetical protein ACOZNI_25010 [Myxococcota bacterium]